MDKLEQQARELLAQSLDERGYPTEANNVRRGDDLESYEGELHALRHALAAQPEPGVVADLPEPGVVVLPGSDLDLMRDVYMTKAQREAFDRIAALAASKAEDDDISRMLKSEAAVSAFQAGMGAVPPDRVVVWSPHNDWNFIAERSKRRPTSTFDGLPTYETIDPIQPADSVAGAVPEGYIQIGIPMLRELIGDERMAEIEAACRFHDPLR